MKAERISPEDHLARAYTEDRGRVLAALIGQFRDFSLAEDALQEAFLRASDLWPREGVPDNPAAWLMTVARRQALDRVRKSARQSADQMQRAVADALTPDVQEVDEMIQDIPDDRLRLIFTCCHPALAQDAQVALTLRTLGGLTVAEIARAFLVAPGAMARRLTRAKTKIRDAGIAYEVPSGRQLPERLSSVLEVIYLIYNESYSATEGPTLTRADLAEEAIRLARLVFALQPDPETEGLLALLLCHDARRPARSGAGKMVPLEAQDRTLWNGSKAAKGHAHLIHALAFRKPGPYQLQAAISATHNRAISWAQTDWTEIAGLYAALATISPGPVVHLNQAVALAYSGNVEIAWDINTRLSDALSDYQPYHAARAEIAHLGGRHGSAVKALKRAIDLAGNSEEASYLADKLERWTKGLQDSPG